MGPKWFSRKVKTEAAIRVIRDEAKLQMASFDNKVMDMVRMFQVISDKLDRLEGRMD